MVLLSKKVSVSAFEKNVTYIVEHRKQLCTEKIC